MSFLRSLALACTLTSSVTPSVCLGLDLTGEIAVFNFYGSSSMRTLMEFMLYRYSQSGSSQKVSFNVSSIGSSSGLDKLLQGSNEFALVSFDASNLYNENEYKAN